MEYEEHYDEPRSSEFGKGLIICMVKFAEHYERKREKFIELLSGNEKLLEKHKTGIEIYGSKEEYISKEIETFMNGASDHLYEIYVPEGEDWDEIREKVRIMKEKALTMGHGFTETIWKIEDLNEIFGMNREISLLIDIKIGLKPEIGKW